MRAPRRARISFFERKAPFSRTNRHNALVCEALVRVLEAQRPEMSTDRTDPKPERDAGTKHRQHQSPLDLVLFEHDPDRALRYIEAGITHLIVDTELKNKQERQRGFDTEIAPTSLRAIGPLKKLAGIFVSCRINGWCDTSIDEVDMAISEGVDRIFLPMVSSFDDVQAFIDAVDGRSEVAILIETEKGVQLAAEIARLPIDAVYVGLNDLAISRGKRFIFSAVRDETVSALRAHFASHQFGFGGVTALGRGSPIPCRMLVAEMARLNCTFSFVRRSFKKDMVGRDMRREIDRIKKYWEMLRRRTVERVTKDHLRLQNVIAQHE